ncbi:MAG: hypothetical protein GF388_02155 [Candidatus Aegiribacteria sp.]|nr:hypothetical protein [Candidatus Aegiribacteria sp.]
MTDTNEWADEDYKWQIVEERKYMWHQSQIDRLASSMGLSHGMTVADIGCGLGYLGWTYWKHFGDYGIGARIPKMMHEADLKDIKGFCRDRLEFLVPPYKEPEQRNRIKIMERFSGESTSEEKIKAKEEYKKYYLAGGGDPASFERDYSRLRELLRKERERRYEQLSAGTLFLCSGGSNFFCIFGIKSSHSDN